MNLFMDILFNSLVSVTLFEANLIFISMVEQNVASLQS